MRTLHSMLCTLATVVVLCTAKLATGSTAPARLAPGQLVASTDHGNAGFPAFSDPPTDLEIRGARMFEEPLLPVGKDRRPDGKEERALVEALRTWSQGRNPEAVNPCVPSCGAILVLAGALLWS